MNGCITGGVNQPGSPLMRNGETSQLNTAGLASLARNTSPCRDFAIMAAMQFVPPLSGPAPRTPDGHPDLSGVWENVRGNVATFAAEVLKRRMAENSKDNPDAHCLVLQD